MSNSFPNTNYGPSGYNDNNFNRRHVPSNIDYNAASTGNPMGHFSGITSNSLKTQQFSNFDNAYKPASALIEKMNYQNKRQLLHDNVNEIVLNEHIVEYKINIDSLDRDINRYPDPFEFKVMFDPIGDGIISTRSFTKNGKINFMNEPVTGAPRPHILKEFRNVKYIKLDSIVLPQYYGTICEDDEIKFDHEKSLINDRFVSLVIEELLVDPVRVYSTSDDSQRTNCDLAIPPKEFGVIFPDKLMGRIYYSGTAYHSSKVYNDSLLGKIKSMSFKFYNGFGEQIKYNDLYKPKQLKEAEEAGEPIPVTNLRHPMNKYIQPYMSFIIGVVEGQISTQTQLER